jgi:RNA 2',3'-cyclic 3'-phosphodiesterase
MNGGSPEMPGARARLFVALELPPSARKALVRWREPVLGASPELRPVAAEALHVTLCFMGSHPVNEIEAIAAAVDQAARNRDVPSLALATPRWLPARRPRALAVEVSDPKGTLAAIQSALSKTLAAGGWYRPEQRRFLPHVTAARVPGGVRLRSLALPDPPRDELQPATVALLRSWLTAGGSRYERLTTVPLASAAVPPEGDRAPGARLARSPADP